MQSVVGASTTSIAEGWHQELKESLRTAEDLYQFGLVNEEEKAALEPIMARYQFLLPRYYANLIDKNDPNCPIRLQALPDAREGQVIPAFIADPLGDLSYRPVSRITHRFPDRVLLHLTSNCSMYCRFCFRKSLLNENEDEMFDGGVAPALSYLRQRTEVEEVIFSGGDPFMASPSTLHQVLSVIAELPHIRRVRFHTRVPVTLPSKVTSRWVQLLGTAKKQLLVVSHFNHPKELTTQSQEAAMLMKEAGIQLFNQTVLLRRVNDSIDVLHQLNLKLFDQGYLPYYLHHPDRAEGTAHFDLSPYVGIHLMRDLRRMLPAYLIPRYVIDLGDERGKVDVEKVYA